MTERERSGPTGADRGLSRRSFLAVASAGMAAALPFVRGAERENRGGRPVETAGFDPTRHGFGFHNWRIQRGPYPGAGGSDPEGGVRRAVGGAVPACVRQPVDLDAGPAP